MWEEWDVRRSLFDNHVAESMEANLAYMWMNFGFYFPEAELLADPEGLLKYLVRLPAILWKYACTTRSVGGTGLPSICVNLCAFTTLS